jgi:hypothetical protein
LNADEYYSIDTTTQPYSIYIYLPFSYSHDIKYDNRSDKSALQIFTRPHSPFEKLHHQNDVSFIL